MQAYLVAKALKFAFSQLRNHPELLEKVTELIPGRVDDLVLKLVGKYLGL